MYCDHNSVYWLTGWLTWSSFTPQAKFFTPVQINGTPLLQHSSFLLTNSLVFFICFLFKDIFGHFDINLICCCELKLIWGDLHSSTFFLAEFKECFSLYDKKQKGKIDTKDLITVMRCLGTSPTIGEVERHLQVHRIGAAHTRTCQHWETQTEHPSRPLCCI